MRVFIRSTLPSARLSLGPLTSPLFSLPALSPHRALGPILPHSISSSPPSCSPSPAYALFFLKWVLSLYAVILSHRLKTLILFGEYMEHQQTAGGPLPYVGGTSRGRESMRID